MKKLFLIASYIRQSILLLKLIVIEYNALRKICKFTLDTESIHYRPIFNKTKNNKKRNNF